VTIKAFVYKQDFGLNDDGYVVYNTDRSGDRWNILVGPCDITYEIPADFNPKAAKIAALEKEAEATRVEFFNKIAALNKQIAELQAIEYTEAA
jgi:hypothetical protein